ncbi:unnamed protein product, partial [Nezara viridula]
NACPKRRYGLGHPQWQVLSSTGNYAASSSSGIRHGNWEPIRVSESEENSACRDGEFSSHAEEPINLECM